MWSADQKNREGARQCQQCHEAGRKVSAARCLTCHQSIAERIVKKTGVHRSVKDDCVSCHSEHAGVNADTRRIDPRTFNHNTETSFPLDGLHARPARQCLACHKTRSFLQARASCVTCHADPHKSSLGSTCASCHSTAVAFRASGHAFDHAKAKFPLAGAHQAVACSACHKSGQFRGVAFATCTSCHQDPHQKKLGAVCTACHTTAQWQTRSINHTKTDFPLNGAHVQVACAKCHQSEAMTRAVRFDRCSACHVNVHRDSITDDCGTCHTEASFHNAPFDHAARTRFVLDGTHLRVECRACHKDVAAEGTPLAQQAADYRGASVECVSCHDDRDPHKGQFGRSCEVCHRTNTFDVKDFRHARVSEFFAGEHEKTACEHCHAPGHRLEPVVSTRRVVADLQAVSSGGPFRPTTECATCHTDVHLGQLAAGCQSCHTVAAAEFAAVGFSHDRAAFPLTGGHATIACAACHKKETRTFPGGEGSTAVFKPLAAECRSCHQDPHLGQVSTKCESCHSTSTFALPTFKHEGMDDFFAGFHSRYACVDCHKKETGRFPARRGTAVRFVVGQTCAACHPQF